MDRITLDGVEFILDIRPGPKRDESKDNTFTLVKTNKLLEFYASLKVHTPKDIMEIGMFEGGSLVYFDKLFKPRKLVGLDNREKPIDALEGYIADKPHIKTYYGRYQEKPGTLSAAQESFPGGIDLVVDDASHLYAQTKATFQMLFPLIRPGGHYVIEDWSWSHMPAHQTMSHAWYQLPAMSNLAVELTILSSVLSVIDSIHIDRHIVSIKKGAGALPPDAFELSKYLRGRELVAF